MRAPSLLLGLAIGLSTGFLLARVIQSHHQLSEPPLVSSDTAWSWADSLDAVKAAPGNHQVLFENEKVRILEVVLDPYEYEALHTHRRPSIMFGPNNDTSHYDIIYYRYQFDSLGHRYAIKDSIIQHNGGESPDKPNKGYVMKPEGPHRIKNLSNVRIDVFRVEFKQ